MFWKGDIQGWLATPEWVWCLWDIKQKTMAKWLPEAANRWQGEGKAHSWGQEEPLVGWLTDCVALCWKELTPPSYCLGRSFFSDCFHCQHDGFALSLLAGKGDSKWDSAALEMLYFSSRSHVQVSEEQHRVLDNGYSYSNLPSRVKGPADPHGTGYWSLHNTSEMVLLWVSCDLLDGKAVRWVSCFSTVTLLPQQWKTNFFLGTSLH